MERLMRRTLKERFAVRGEIIFSVEKSLYWNGATKNSANQARHTTALRERVYEAKVFVFVAL